MPIPFNSLQTQLAPEEDSLRQAFERVLARGWFLMGPEVDAFESEFSAWLGRPKTVAVNSGTDALVLALRSLDPDPGDEVLLPAHTALPCYHAVLAAGMTPVFTEVEEDTYTMDPASAQSLLSPRTRAIMAVHLYGQACDMDALLQVARSANVPLIEDCAQSHGAEYKGKRLGSMGDFAAFSFYPTKNLGALGDGGAVCGPDDTSDASLRLLRQYGEASRYESVVPGVNTRMDELQAAFLRERLQRLDETTAQRRHIAALYDAGLAGLPLTTPAVRAHTQHVYHLYVIRTRQRDALAAHLQDNGVGTAIHYPAPGHQQALFTQGGAPFHAGELGLSERLADEILSLPMYPGLTDAQVHTICDAVRGFFGQGS